MVRRVLQRWLQQWNHDVIAVDNGAAAWEVLQQKQPPKRLILDWMMPEMDGLELCRRIRADQRSAYRYILLITAKDARQDLVSGFDAGADDYLTKPFDCDELRARLRVGERTLILQGDLIRARDALHFQATHDVLTGLCNRGTVFDVFVRELERSRRTRVPLAVLMLDLDHFKRINDNHGHLAGDAVLKEAVRSRKQCARMIVLADTVAKNF
jgi:two-component system, cell cycle response regulator